MAAIRKGSSRVNYEQQTYINIDQYTHNKLYSNTNPNQLIRNLVKNNKLQTPNINDNGLYKKYFHNHSSLLSVCVIPQTRTMPYTSFESTHYIWFQYKIYKKKRKRKLSSISSINNIYYAYYPIKITYYQLQNLDKFIFKNNVNNKYFAQSNSGFPTPLVETINKRNFVQNEHKHNPLYNITLNESMKIEESFISQPILPCGPSSGIFSFKRIMTLNTLQEYGNYLNTLFASPSLCLCDYLYDELKINDNEIRNLFKTLALQKLETFYSLARYNESLIRDPQKLMLKHATLFHTAWICGRPLNNPQLKLFNFDHWAIKFEGVNHLMTIEFFSFNDEHGIVTTKIVPNTVQNRRIFWYYWQRDDIDIYLDQSTLSWFNYRWDILNKIYLGSISCNIIGLLITSWLLCDGHAVYDVAHNNCQHFVRDIVTALDINIARKLNSSFDQKVIASVIPAGILAESIDEEAKTNKIHKYLMLILKEHNNKIIKLKKKNLNKTIKQKQKEEFENNFNFIAKEFGILNINNDISDDLKQNNDNNNNINSLDIYKKPIKIMVDNNISDLNLNLNVSQSKSQSKSQSMNNNDNDNDVIVNTDEFINKQQSNQTYTSFKIHNSSMHNINANTTIKR